MGYTFANNEIATAAKLRQTIPNLVTQAGAVVVTPVANTQTPIQVTFPVPFVNVPRILVSPVTIYPGAVVKGVGATNVTRTGFTLWILRTTSTKTTVMWQAWGAQPATFTDGQPVPATALNASASLTPMGGEVSINAGGSDPKSANVTFATPFAATPVVCVSPVTSVPGSQVQQCSLSNLTATGFTGWIYRIGGTTATPLHWIALGSM